MGALTSPSASMPCHLITQRAGFSSPLRSIHTATHVGQHVLWRVKEESNGVPSTVMGVVQKKSKFKLSRRHFTASLLAYAKVSR